MMKTKLVLLLMFVLVPIQAQSLLDVQNLGTPTGYAAQSAQSNSRGALNDYLKSISMLTFLKNIYLGKKISVSSNKGTAQLGMVTKVVETETDFVLTVWNLREKTLNLKVVFQKNPGLRDDISQKREQFLRKQREQTIEVEKYLNNSSIVGSGAGSVDSTLQSVQNDPSLLPENRNRKQTFNEIEYIDTQSNKTFKSKFVIINDKLYLEDGFPITIKLEKI